MFLLCPLLIGAIIYYTVADILTPRKKRRQEWVKLSGKLYVYDGRTNVIWAVGDLT